MAEKITLNDHTLERRIFLSRLIVASIMVVLLIGVLIARLVYLQIFEHEYYSTKSDNYRIHVRSVVPTRGLIYDRNGILLAENKPGINLTMVRENVEDIDASIALLSTLIEFSEEDAEKLYTRLKRRRVPFSSVLVRLDLSEEEVARIAVNQFRLPGVSVEAQLVRHYPQGESMAHAIGYLSSITEEELQVLDSENYSGTNQTGKMGIEKFYEGTLHGQVGYETVERNARGQIMKVLDRTDPVPGEDIILHLDSKLQQAAMEALADKRGGVIALDVESGGVLAMVSKPSFDPNLFVQGISQREYAKLNDPIEMPLYNRALARYSPGSTMKPFVGLAGLNTGVRDRDYTVSDPGYFNLEGDSHVYHDWTWWGDKNGHGIVDLEKAIYQSCDIYFYDLAVDLGIDQMHDFLFQFGFGRNTSIDIPQSSNGILPSRAWKLENRGEPWYPGETLNSSIGQGYTEATSLQLATATLILANKGKAHEPVMLKRIGLESEDVTHPSHLPDVQLQDNKNWGFIAGAMEKVIHRGNGGYRDNGTAYAYVAMKEKMGYRMAGKSGTAQVVGMAADYDKDEEVAERFRDHALFIAFAPVENPKIALAVFVEHGEGGSSVAGPIARKVIDAYLLEDGELKPEFLNLQEQPSVASLSH